MNTDILKRINNTDIDMSDPMLFDPEYMSKFIDLLGDDRKLCKKGGKAELYVGTDYTSLTVNGDTGVAVVPNGVIIKGKNTHIASDLSNTRFDGFMTIDPLNFTTLPSTTFTPIPMFQWKNISLSEFCQDMNNMLV